jgi:hypothetical protein
MLQTHLHQHLVRTHGDEFQLRILKRVPTGLQMLGEFGMDARDALGEKKMNKQRVQIIEGVWRTNIFEVRQLGIQLIIIGEHVLVFSLQDGLRIQLGTVLDDLVSHRREAGKYLRQ